MSIKTFFHFDEETLISFFKDTLIKNIVILGLGYLIFYIDDKEFLDDFYTKLLIVGISFLKVSFFFIQSLVKILEVSDKNIAYYHFLIFMAKNIFLIILSFTIDFICIYQVDPTSFSGIPETLSFWESSFELFYVSILGFNNLGFYDVIPMSKAVKVLVIMEVFAYMSTIIFILSDFMSLKESFIAVREKRRNKNLEK